jgi:hypothetical protein
VGGAICGAFVIFGGLSVMLYKPWRRRVDRHYASRYGLSSDVSVALGEDDDEMPKKISLEEERPTKTTAVTISEEITASRS